VLFAYFLELSDANLSWNSMLH